MKVELYQIDPAKDENGVRFRSFSELPKLQGSRQPDASLYRKVYEGEFPGHWELDDLYAAFNAGGNLALSEYRMTVSDVVAVSGSEKFDPGSFYCDSFGWEEVAFDRDRAAETELSVLYCAPGEEARAVRIGAELADLQEAVGGYIEICFPFAPEPGGEEVCLVCNEEGKLIPGTEPCRALRSEDGSVRDVVYGPFLLCSVSGENLRSLSPEAQEKYREKFGAPERFDSRGLPLEQTAVREEAAPCR